MRTLKATVLLVAAIGVVIVLVLSESVGRSKPVKPNTAHFLGITTGLVGPMSTTYQTFSTNTAATIQKWLDDGTNAALVRITNNQSCAIRLFPFTRIQTQAKSSGSYESLLLDAPNFSGVRLPAGQAANIQVAIFAQSEPWRIEVGYTRESNNSFVEWLRNLPRDLRAMATKRGIVEHTTPIHTEWIQP